jgi:hypothetical protein
MAASISESGQMERNLEKGNFLGAIAVNILVVGKMISAMALESSSLPMGIGIVGNLRRAKRMGGESTTLRKAHFIMEGSKMINAMVWASISRPTVKNMWAVGSTARNLAKES